MVIAEMGKIKLDLDVSDDDEPLKINSAYAERYDNWRRLEEIQKLSDRIGSKEESDEDSSSSEESADWTAEHEMDFLRTLSALKTRDPKIYTDEKFFKAEASKNATNLSSEKRKKRKDEAPMYLKDYERKLILERGGDISDDDENSAKEREADPSYFEKQQKIKQELKEALNTFDDGENDSDSDLLVKREKTASEIKKEEDEYYEWLKGQNCESAAKFDDLKGLRDAWNDKNLDSDEKFLRDYLLNKQYDIDGHSEIPTYDEIVGIQDDEEELEREREFERKFNFRFEEPDQEFIKQYPRTTKESVRKSDDKRKERRDAYKERKALEKQKKKDEIRELKALKKKEIESKLEKLKKIAGDDDIPLNFDDLEADFDPAAYDKRMQELFNENYYEKGGDDEDEKPEFSDHSEDSDESDYDNFAISTVPEGGEGVEDHEREQKEEEALSEKRETSKRKKKRNSIFAAAVLKKKPIFDPKEKTFEEYLSEYYALDYEDIIGGDLITRFKYRSVPPNSFGLTGDEILSADDRQLNAWASLKKATAYRTEVEERYDLQAYEKKAKNIQKKERIFSTDFGGKRSKKLKEELKEEEKITSKEKVNEDGKMSKKKKKKRKKKKITNSENIVNGEAPTPVQNNEQKEVESSSKKGRSRKRKRHGFSFAERQVAPGVDDDRLRAYGVNPKRFKNRLFRRKD